MDTWVVERKIVDSVLIVQDFPNVFHEEFLGVPLVRQVDFQIDFILGSAPIVKSPYQLAPLEMQVASTQLQEALDKGFINHSSSPKGENIPFLKKNDGSHRMYIDYRELNKLTMKNR